MNLISSISFGELEISSGTVIVLAVIAIFPFLAVGISTLKLVQSAFDRSDDDVSE